MPSELLLKNEFSQNYSSNAICGEDRTNISLIHASIDLTLDDWHETTELQESLA